MEDHNALFKMIFAICITIFILAILGTIAGFLLKAWFVVEGVKAVESAGGLAGIFEKILQLFQ